MNIETAIKVNAQNVQNAQSVEALVNAQSVGNALIVEAIVVVVIAVANAEAEVAVAHTEAPAAASKRTQQNAPLTGKIAMLKVLTTASKKSRRKSAVQQLSAVAGNRTVENKTKSETKTRRNVARQTHPIKTETKLK